MNQDSKEPDENWHLDDQWAQTANRAHSGISVHFHRFLRDSSAVSCIFGLHVFHLGLEFCHFSHLAELFQGQRQRYEPYYDCEHQNRYSHVLEKDDVKDNQCV